jgi:hypothetical protein
VLTVVPAPESTGRVFDNPKPVFARDLIDSVHIGGESKEMHRKNRPCFSGNLPLQLLDIDIECVQIDIAEHHLTAEMFYDICSRDPGKCWNDYLITGL